MRLTKFLIDSIKLTVGVFLVLILIVLPLSPLFASEVATDSSLKGESEEHGTQSSSVQNDAHSSDNDRVSRNDINIKETETNVDVPNGGSPDSESPRDDERDTEQPIDIPLVDAGNDLQKDIIDETLPPMNDIDSPPTPPVPDVRYDEDGVVIVDDSEVKENPVTLPPDIIGDDTDLEPPISPVATLPVFPSSTVPIEELPDNVPVQPLPDVDSENDDHGDPIELEKSISSTSSGSSVVAVNTISNDDNKYTFSKDECVSVGDGSFYCSNSDTPTVIASMDRVFSAPDSDGDKEIFIEKDSKIIQISKNLNDDEAPQYDELSNSIVWQELIDGRYQIISYDVAQAETVQLTFDRFNNMQPDRYESTTVWQGWVGNDWEIFLLKEDSEPIMITDNATHDVDPSINGDNVVWQSFESNSWKMKVYNVQTNIIETIEDSNGGYIENPRFVLVYDTKQDTGDVETHGYDLKSKEVIKLGSVPAPIPKHIPDPEHTGEKRALVSPQNAVKTKVEGDDNHDDSDSDTTKLDAADNTITDIVIPSLTVGTEADASTSTQSTVDENDLVVVADDEINTQNTIHIKDLIITPFVEDITNSNDSQDEVATSS